MKKIDIIDSANTPDGSVIYLQNRDADYSIMVNGNELMSTRQQYSEVRLAEIVCLPYKNQDVQVLIGGLGFGYTLQSALQCVSIHSTVVVAELMPCVIKWNQDKTLPLAHKALADDRVQLINGDVMEVLRENFGKFDGIMLDVDNGPDAFTDDGNDAIYTREGLQILKSALKRGGTVGIWSAQANPQFEKAMSKAGFKARSQKERARPDNKGAVHTIFVGEL